MQLKIMKKLILFFLSMLSLMSISFTYYVLLNFETDFFQQMMVIVISAGYQYFIWFVVYKNINEKLNYNEKQNKRTDSSH